MQRCSLSTLAKCKGEICYKCKPSIAVKVKGDHRQKSDNVVRQNGESQPGRLDKMQHWRKLQQYPKAHILKLSELQHPNKANLGMRMT